ncbi:MAG: hypothetical protein QXL10_00940 [Candidatus Bathyarchaeia archaeon]
MKKQIVSLLFAVALLLSSFALQVAPVSAQDAYCDFEIRPYPVFGRNANQHVFSRLYNAPQSPFGVIEARLLKWVTYQWFDGNGDLYNVGSSGWLWAKTITFPANEEQHWAYFMDLGTIAGMSWGWNPWCQQWDMVRWEVSFRVEWWYSDWLYQPVPVKIAETDYLTMGHDEVKGKISGVARFGRLSGYGNVYNPYGIIGLWPDNNYAAIYGYQSGDSAHILGWTNAYLGSPYMHRIEMYCYTVSGYSPMVYVYVSNDFFNWELLWSGRIWHTSPGYIDLGYPVSQFQFVTVVAQVPQGQYGAILYVDCLTIYPYWF